MFQDSPPIPVSLGDGKLVKKEIESNDNTENYDDVSIIIIDFLILSNFLIKKFIILTSHLFSRTKKNIFFQIKRKKKNKLHNLIHNIFLINFYFVKKFVYFVFNRFYMLFFCFFFSL